MLKLRNWKLIVTTSAAALALPAIVVLAASTNVHSTATFRQAITLTSNADLDFSKIDYSSPTVTASDFVEIGDNGTPAYGGNWTPGAGASPTAGDVQIVSGDPLPAAVECSSTATLANGSHTIMVTSIQGSDQTYLTSFGGGNPCHGIGGGPAMTGNLPSSADHLKFGGKLDGGTASGGTIVSGTYSTVNAGGSDLQVEVYYQ